MKLPGWRLHRLRGGFDGHWAIGVDKNWRLTFTFAGVDVVAVDYRDYHWPIRGGAHAQSPSSR